MKLGFISGIRNAALRFNDAVVVFENVFELISHPSLLHCFSTLCVLCYEVFLHKVNSQWERYSRCVCMCRSIRMIKFSITGSTPEPVK
jgi:hypothetical protein